MYTQSRSILRYAGRLSALYPKDALAALKVDMIIDVIEDLTLCLSKTMRIADADEKKAAREAFAQHDLPRCCGVLETLFKGNGPFFAGKDLSIADLQLYAVVGWMVSGQVDHVPTTALDNEFPKTKACLVAVGERVSSLAD